MVLHFSYSFSQINSNVRIWKMRISNLQRKFYKLFFSENRPKSKKFPVVIKCMSNNRARKFPRIKKDFLFLIVCPLIGLLTFLGNFRKLWEISWKLYVEVFFYFFARNFLKSVCPVMWSPVYKSELWYIIALNLSWFLTRKIHRLSINPVHRSKEGT